MSFKFLYVVDFTARLSNNKRISAKLDITRHVFPIQFDGVIYFLSPIMSMISKCHSVVFMYMTYFLFVKAYHVMLRNISSNVVYSVVVIMITTKTALTPTDLCTTHYCLSKTQYSLLYIFLIKRTVWLGCFACKGDVSAK